MSCVDWANLVAKEFEYGQEDVRKATKHFVRQLGKYIDALNKHELVLSKN